MSRVPARITKQHILTALCNIEEWCRLVRAAIDASDCDCYVLRSSIMDDDVQPVPKKIWDCPGDPTKRVWDCPPAPTPQRKKKSAKARRAKKKAPKRR